MTLQSTSPGSCYNIAGLLAPFDEYTYVPCNHTALELGQHSTCCGVNDNCLTNGLCGYSGPSEQEFNEWWRVGCTDPTYQDPSCPRFCENIDPDLPTHLVFQCPGTGKWCCATGDIETFGQRGTVNTTCCAIEGLKFEDVEGVVYTNAKAWDMDVKTSMVRASRGPSATEGGAQSATATVTATQTRPGDANAAATAVLESTQPAKSISSSNVRNYAYGFGFGLGIPLVTIIIIVFIFMCSKLERRSQRHHRAASTNPQQLSVDTKNKEPRSGIAVFMQKFKRRKPSVWGAESEEDLRRTHPHAFNPEVDSKETAAEIDGRKSPLELWSPVEEKEDS